MVGDAIDKADVKDKASAPAEVVELKPDVTDRRRPGRVNYSNPALIALLRKPAADPAEREGVGHLDDAIAPARGIMIGVPIGALIWCAIALGLWYLLR